jgi:hypothetical protein
MYRSAEVFGVNLRAPVKTEEAMAIATDGEPVRKPNAIGMAVNSAVMFALLPLETRGLKISAMPAAFMIFLKRKALYVARVTSYRLNHLKGLYKGFEVYP